ncbi:NAD(P)H-hydrate epimerase [Oikeobacillus pervagus]|uniref:Bifunctional NAD(P)H-hydrate repair enzyme n=1 Tax=Oikeobacillus pervagus TaxID=1325931 RepID=A0AAJ1WFU2_9BACI|nr:NAD(P)H-hydrate dehydratase [Oikeobacillus pervagus]MDQ0214337.1 NAD(P)H-hydrate epimerase [Oikeobacillus pervagus]
MYIYTSEQIKAADQLAEKRGMSTFSLMENAGCGLYHAICPYLSTNQKLLIASGKGNNGGDGIVLARYLKMAGFEVDLIFPLGEPKTGVAKQHLHYYEQCGFPVEEWNPNQTYDVIVDALLGVGAILPLQESLVEWIKWMKSMKATIISIDVPTGISSNSGVVDQNAIKADYTFSLHGYKPSRFLFPSSHFYGQVEVVDIGLPQKSNWRVWTEKDVQKSWVKRETNAHKGLFGTGLLIAGSHEMPGSAALAASSAMRFGIGKLTVNTTQHASAIIGPIVPEVTFLYHTYEELVRSEWKNRRFTCAAIGPGLDPTDDLEKLVTYLLKQNVPLILDAGAIQSRSYPRGEKPIILTPHPGEFSRLLQLSTKEIQENRIELASEYAVTHHVILILKGEYTVIAFPDGTGYINTTGNASLAKGGSGDALTGMLLASIEGNDCVKAAVLNAVYIHGVCSDEWVRKYSEHTFVSSDFSSLLPMICKSFEKE